MVKHKIIFVGPVGAGKTTAINAISEQRIVSTDAPVTDMTRERKLTTTVAMDYGVVTLENGHVVHLYGTPGQERFDFMWDILSKGATGIVLLLDNSRNYPYRDLKYYCEVFSKLISNVPLVIGITRFDTHKNPPVAAYQQWLTELEVKAELLPIDGRKAEDVLRLVNLVVLSNDNSKSDTTVANIKPKDDTPENEKIYEAKDTMQLSEDSLQQVKRIRGVKGVTLTNDMGELLHSTIDDESINEFVAFLSGLTPAIEADLAMGRIHRIMLRGPKDDNLTVFVEEEKSLGVSSERRISIPALSQQVEDMLQWN